MTGARIHFAAVFLLVAVACVNLTSCGLRDDSTTDRLAALPEGKLVPAGATLARERRLKGTDSSVAEVSREYTSTLTRDEVLQFYSSEFEIRKWEVFVPFTPYGTVWKRGAFTVQLSFGDASLGPTDPAKRFVVIVEEN